VNEFAKVKPGLAVSDIANRHIGAVTQVALKAFRLTFLDGRHVWLTPLSLFSVDQYRAVLVCNDSGLAPYLEVPD
jgi:hypothetical protein